MTVDLKFDSSKTFPEYMKANLSRDKIIMMVYKNKITKNDNGAHVMEIIIKNPENG